MQSQSASSVFKFSQDIERLIFEQAAFRDIGTALNLVLVSKAVREWVLPALYTDVNITRSDQYLLYLRNFTYNVFKGEWDRDREAKKVARAVAADRAGCPNPFTDLLRTLTLHVPPPTNLIAKLTKENPQLKVNARTGRSFESDEEEFDDDDSEPGDDLPWTSCYIPIRLDKLTIHARESNFHRFKGIAELLDPTHFHLKSMEKLAMVWRTKYTVIPASWLAMESLLMEDVVPLRPEMGDMTEGVAIPFMCCQQLRQMTVLIRKFDHPAGAGIVQTIFFEIPKKNDALFKLQHFLIQITGKNRFAVLRRKWEKEFKPMLANWRDAEAMIKLLKMELVDGPIGVCPERVLSDDEWWYDKHGNEVGKAGSSADEYSDDEDEDEEDSDVSADSDEEKEPSGKWVTEWHHPGTEDEYSVSKWVPDEAAPES